jgi:hypothetical protein
VTAVGIGISSEPLSLVRQPIWLPANSVNQNASSGAATIDTGSEFGVGIACSVIAPVSAAAGNDTTTAVVAPDKPADPPSSTPSEVQEERKLSICELTPLCDHEPSL